MRACVCVCVCVYACVCVRVHTHALYLYLLFQTGLPAAPSLNAFYEDISMNLCNSVNPGCRQQPSCDGLV